MKAKVCLSNVIVAVLVFSSQCVLFAQLAPDLPPSRFPMPQPRVLEDSPFSSRRALADYIPSIPDFAKLLVKPNEQDDPIKKLQREQLIEAFSCAGICRTTFELSSSGSMALMTDLHKYQKLAAVAAFDLAETNVKKIECLEFVVDVEKHIERIEIARRETDGRWLGASTAKYWRLEAEINLLKFKRESALEK